MKKLTARQRKPRICLVAHFAYGALTGGHGGHIGGVERQTSLMAKWLAAREYPVSLITWDEGQEDGIEINGVQVFKVCQQKAGLPGLRFFWPRWMSFVAALKRADADLYYQNCGEYVTGQVALWCRRWRRRFVYSVANDTDCEATLPEMHSIRERVFYRYGLTRADQVIVQTCRQQQLLRTAFGRDSVILPMPCAGPSDEEYGCCEQARSGTRRVLWIGRICEQKRPDRLLDIAEICPDVDFDFVGPVSKEEYAHRICRRARRAANVTVHGPATRERVSDFYRKAKVMCCTSAFEGFPNTFLEAWSWGLPIVSTFDPDNLIIDKGLGRIGTDVPQLAAGIREMLNTPEQWQMASQAARKYFAENHALDLAMERFERVFLEAAGVPSCGQDGGRREARVCNIIS